ncbi:MAG: histidine kinase, partial [Elusimicrobia bacterium]|nr:histidine kinase [Elusimicrobiota bacterium]
MVILLLFVSVVLFVLADLAVREVTRALREKRLRLEREEALAVSLKLDFTREAPTLKRAEVKEPVARILCV